MVRDRMAERDGNLALKALRQSALYEPMPEHVFEPRYRTKLLSPTGWCFLGCIAFWAVVAFMIWGR